jgi:hypothetical protein
MRDKARYWVSADTTEYDEVDRHRALETMPAGDLDRFDRRELDVEPSGGNRDGEEGKVKGGKVDGYSEFGHDMLEHFQFEEGCKSDPGISIDGQRRGH